MHGWYRENKGGDMKVYCKNCKWYKSKNEYYNDRCKYRIKIKQETFNCITGVKRKYIIYKYPIEIARLIGKDKCGWGCCITSINDIDSFTVLNKKNKCKYYKRKWWKFWIKEGI